MNTMLQGLDANLASVAPQLATFAQNATTASSSVVDVTNKLGELTAGFTGLVKKQMDANSAIQQSSLNLQLAKVALDAATPGTQQYATALEVVTRAQVALGNATQAATPHAKNYGDTIAGVTQNLALAQEKFQSLLAVFSTVNAAVANGTGSVNLQAEAYTKLEAAAKASGNSFADYNGILAQVQVTTNQAYASYQQLGAAYGTLLTLQKSGVDVTAQLADVYKQWEAAGTKVGIAVTTIAGQMALFTTAAEKQATTLTDNVGAFSKFAQIQQPTIAQVDATRAAFLAITQEATSMGIQLTQTANGFGFTAEAGTKATPALQAYINQLNAILGTTGPLVDVNGKWVQSMSALPAWLQQLVTGLEKQSGAAKDATAATQAHSQSMVDNAAAAARAQQAQIDLGSTYQTVANTITQLTNAGKNQVTNLENMVGAFTSLNATTQTTISGQLALQNALKDATTAGAALGITITSIGATTNSTNPAIIALTAAINQQIQAANNGSNSNQSYIGSLNGITTAAQNASVALSGLGNAMGQVGNDNMTGAGGMSNTSAADTLSMYAAMGAPADVIDKMAAALGYVQVGNNDFVTIAEYVASFNAAHKGETMTAIDNGTIGGGFTITPDATSSSSSGSSSVTTANTSAITANTAAVTSSTTATNSSIPVMQAYTSNLQVSGTALGNAIPTIANLGAAIAATTTATTAAIPVMQALLTTSDSAANEISKFGANAGELTAAQQNYESALADSTNATNAFYNALNSGTSTSGQLTQLWQAAQDAAGTLDDLVGSANVTTSAASALAQGMWQAQTTSDTAAQEIAGLGIQANQLTTAQQNFYSAVADSTNATNAFNNALVSGTATQQQLNQLWAAALQAASAVQNATGSGSVGNPNQSSSSTNVSMPAAPTAPPTGLTPLQIATGAWQPDYANGTWVWNQNANTAAGAQGSSNNFAGASAGPGEPIDYSSNVGLGLSGTNPFTGQSYGTTTPPVNLNITINAGTVVGQNAAQQLTNLVMPQMVAQLRQAGVKI
jgi:hypothetical protein